MFCHTWITKLYVKLSALLLIYFFSNLTDTQSVYVVVYFDVSWHVILLINSTGEIIVLQLSYYEFDIYM